jgi:hypothetical protein
MSRDFSDELVIDDVSKLREIFTKDEILTFPSIEMRVLNIGLIPFVE